MAKKKKSRKLIKSKEIKLHLWASLHDNRKCSCNRHILLIFIPQFVCLKTRPN